jgi:hypothetical protein
MMSTRRAEPINAFSQEYLEAVQEQDEPSTTLAAETAGPFSLVEQQGMVALFHAWESHQAGDMPQALFHQRETALLFQAIWPAVGQRPLFRLRDEPCAAGYVLEEEGRQAGSFQSFNPDTATGGHFASYLARTPWSLALLVEASGPVAQRHLGRILGRRMQGARP